MTEGNILKLLINFPPRCGKTKVVSICYPAWVWARSQKSFWSGPGVRFLCGSYNHTLALTNSTLCRRLILTPWYQARWGKSVVLTTDQNSKYQFDTKEQGSRISTSVGGSLLGIGGDIILIDDPHNTEQVESDADRETATTWWSEIRSTRLNDPQKSAIVVVMQRLHNDDISGLIAQGDDYPDWTHLMLPMRHDVGRHCSTVLKYDAEGEPEIEWDDPRTEEGELLWPQRFGPKEVALLERELGPYMASGRLQQMPVPRGGAIIKREYWQLWPDETPFPDFEFVLASADTAYTEKEENDPTGFTVWGIFKDKSDQPKAMLIWAWAKRLELHGAKVERNVGETEKEYEKRSSKTWGLVEWLAYSCRRFHVDLLLIEAKASGITVAQEMQRLHGYEKWMTKTVTPVGDKVSRAHSVEPIFAQGIVFAPDQQYAEKVISEAEVFPKGKHDDLCLVGETVIATRRGPIRIDTVRVGDEVITPSGWQKIVAANFTGVKETVTHKGLIGTPNHPIFTFENNYTNLSEISSLTVSRFGLCDLIKTIRQRKLNLRALSTAVWAEDADTISANQKATQEDAGQKDFMSRYGNRTIMHPLLSAIMFIISMATASIAALRIWNAYRLVCIKASLRILIEKLLKSILRGLDRWQAHGILRLPGLNGIGNMPIIRFINRVLKRSLNQREILLAFGAGQSPLQCLESAYSVGQNAPSLSVHLGEGNESLFTHSMRKVYNLTVEGDPCYYANGVLVHNCDSTTMALQYLRLQGLIAHSHEVAAELAEQTRFKPQQKPLYEV